MIGRPSLGLPFVMGRPAVSGKPLRVNRVAVGRRTENTGSSDRWNNSDRNEVRCATPLRTFALFPYKHVVV
jgi:hypothetical protein